MLIWFIGIFIISLILAFRSMNDFDIPKEIKHLLMSRKIRGTILFLKGKVKHYSSTSSLSSGS
ncbi:hypothetical protein CO008_03670 [Candidatus Roizmanbacteria bacterium CG_4_8_14_3_um_filter_36_12]|nr:MAG: hypothetical protein CO008_03670 [Candidatus Roizmanbacteria bacterium CG_4_8_14_3_um_filter_36_12]